MFLRASSGTLGNILFGRWLSSWLSDLNTVGFLVCSAGFSIIDLSLLHEILGSFYKLFFFLLFSRWLRLLFAVVSLTIPSSPLDLVFCISPVWDLRVLSLYILVLDVFIFKYF